MKIQLILALCVNCAAASRVANVDVHRNQAHLSMGTCPGPNRLSFLRSQTLPHLQTNKSSDPLFVPYTLYLKVAETKTDQEVRSGGPIFESGLRYLIFDEERPNVIVGDGCNVQSKVACKKTSLRAPEGASCGRVCEPDVSVQFGYVRSVLSAASIALVTSKGKDYAPKHAAVVGVGAGSEPAWLLANFKSLHVDAVDIEEAVMKTAVECFGLGITEGAPERLHQHVEEGIKFLTEQPQGHYDLLFLDVSPIPTTFKDALPTIYDRIAPGGVLLVNLWSSDAEHVAFVKAATATFGRVWKSRVFDADIGGNTVLFSIKANSTRASPTAEEMRNEVPRNLATWFENELWDELKA